MYEIKESVTCQHCREKPHVGDGGKIFSEQCILYCELYFLQFSILYFELYFVLLTTFIRKNIQRSVLLNQECTSLSYNSQKKGDTLLIFKFINNIQNLLCICRYIKEKLAKVYQKTSIEIFDEWVGAQFAGSNKLCTHTFL